MHSEYLAEMVSEHKYYESIHDDQQSKFISSKIDQKANEQYLCNCSLCYVQSIQPIPVPHPVSDALNGTSVKTSESDYLFIIKRLHPPKGKTRCLRIIIPETTVLNEKGEFEMTIFCSREDRRQAYYNFHLVRQKFNFNGLRKFLKERRKIYVHTMNLYHMRAEGSSKNTPRTNQPQSVLTLGKALVTIKTRFILKKSRQEAQEDNFERSIKESLLLRYRDGSYQVLSEAEITNLLLQRRRIDWTQISYAQQYYKPEHGYKFLQVKFIFQRDRHHPLFTQSENEILSINNEISKASEDFVPIEKEEEYEMRLAKSDEATFLRYLTFKIYHYLKKFSNIKLMQGQFDYMKDDMDQYMLVQASRVICKPLEYIRHDENERLVINHVPESEEKTEIIENDPEVIRLTAEMRGQYDEWKKQLGMRKTYDIPRDVESDLVFMKLYPKNSFVDFTMATQQRKRQSKSLKDDRKRTNATQLSLSIEPQTNVFSSIGGGRNRESLATDLTHTRALTSLPQTSYTNQILIQKQSTQAHFIEEARDYQLVTREQSKRPRTGTLYNKSQKSVFNNMRIRKRQSHSVVNRQSVKQGTLPFYLYKNCNFSTMSTQNYY